MTQQIPHRIGDAAQMAPDRPQQRRDAPEMVQRLPQPPLPAEPARSAMAPAADRIPNFRPPLA
jgi:hypothetical protein